jgi:hypothetical protein
MNEKQLKEFVESLEHVAPGLPIPALPLGIRIALEPLRVSPTRDRKSGLRPGLVLDANILLGAVSGQRVRELLEAFEDAVTFYSPAVCLC